jgi:hypothetical protein
MWASIAPAIAQSIAANREIRNHRHDGLRLFASAMDDGQNDRPERTDLIQPRG